jgi:hypothetical protein
MDFTQLSDLDLHNELLRRRQVLDNDNKGLSVIPLEFLISEYEKRKSDITSELHIKSKELEEWNSEDEDYTILFNAIKTPDGNVLSSRHRHDFVVHTDEVTGKKYGVDGGADYFRRIGDVSDCEDLSITDKTPMSEIRQKFHWGSYGVNGDEPLKMIRMSEMSNSHIQAVIKNVFKDKKSTFKSWFESELKFREESNILIEG